MTLAYDDSNLAKTYLRIELDKLVKVNDYLTLSALKAMVRVSSHTNVKTLPGWAIELFAAYDIS